MTWRGRSHSPSPATFIWNDYVLCEQFQHYLRMLWVTITFNSHGLTDNQINFTSKPKQVYTSLATLLQLYPMKEVSTTLIWTLQWHFLFLFFPESNFLLNEVGQNWQMLNLPLQTSRGRSQGWDKGVGPRPAILNASNDPQQFLFFSFHPTKKTMPALPNFKKKNLPLHSYMSFVHKIMLSVPHLQGSKSNTYVHYHLPSKQLTKISFPKGNRQ